MVMNADGTNQRTVLQAPSDQLNLYNATPNWSPDGTQLVFSSSIQGAGIYIINKNGTGLRKVIATNSTIFNDPIWSPVPTADDQWKIAFVDLPPGETSWHDIFVVNLNGSGLLNLTNTTDRDEFYPTWDPFATRLAAQSSPASNSPGNIASLYQYDLGLVSGVVGITNTTNLTAAGALQNASIYTPDWGRSTTQDQIMVTARLLSDINNSAVWIVSLADPENPVELMATYGIQPLRPSWSPDDSKIVFAQGGGFAPIAIIDADGSGLATLGVTGALPDWRRCCPECATVCAPSP
jgi:Tol biopolymer transport system component